MGAGRPNWYYDHPPACTCAQCNMQRINRKTIGEKVKGWFRGLWPFGKGKKGK